MLHGVNPDAFLSLCSNFVQNIHFCPRFNKSVKKIYQLIIQEKHMKYKFGLFDKFLGQQLTRTSK